MLGPSHFAGAGTRSRANRRRLSENDIRCSASDRRWFPAQHVHRRPNNGRARIQSALASARAAETAKRRVETCNAHPRQHKEAVQTCKSLPTAMVGTRSRGSRRRLSDNDIQCSGSDRRWFPARPAHHVHRRRNNGKGPIPSALASAHGRNGERRGETCNAIATPDAPEHIDNGRRCTRHDHRTCCRGSRGSASLPRHVSRKTRRNVPLHQGFFARDAV